MGSSSDLASHLDFNLGLEFQDEVRRHYKSPVHHPYPTPNGSFFLLVTFRRFLFRLTEDTVALALQSCLGGKALDFHVQFLSNNHFRFSVFSKDVGFFVYKLRRVITNMFDIYFHLWNNGTPHWEREKHAWEIEQEREWTKVLSRSSKKAAAKASKSQKKVSFAKQLVQQSSPKCSPPWHLKFGAFTVEVSCNVSEPSDRLVFGNAKLNFHANHDRVHRYSDLEQPRDMQPQGDITYFEQPQDMQ